MFERSPGVRERPGGFWNALLDTPEHGCCGLGTLNFEHGLRSPLDVALGVGERPPQDLGRQQRDPGTRLKQDEGCPLNTCAVLRPLG